MTIKNCQEKTLFYKEVNNMIVVKNNNYTEIIPQDPQSINLPDLEDWDKLLI